MCYLDWDWAKIIWHFAYERRGCLDRGGSVNRCFKAPVIIANADYRKGLFNISKTRQRETSGFLPKCVPTSRGDRPAPASPPKFSVSYFSMKFSELETPIYHTEPSFVPRMKKRLPSRR
jgi:hypothetical protein